ncbi:ribosomal protein L22 [Durotheca rogersii]|uniref:ribosomal protein L22 n=1 Tax=Durotheca rogersii TaxID=419775 RepID=UPI002220B0E4|nr:ribosomal protein L22 [Durotheca rogersii]KAI5860816.1 ribosomal protein L22 [Durotheca rogersii]
MSLRLPARQVVQTARAATGKSPSSAALRLLPRTQRRSAWFWGNKAGKKKDSSPASQQSELSKELSRREREQLVAARNMDRTGGASIFDEEIKESERKLEAEGDVGGPPPPGGEGQGQQRPPPSITAGTQIKEHMEMALDPDPRWRVRYTKRKVMQMMRGGDRITREQRIRMTEKEHRSKSTLIGTSPKKLVMLARQIAGKTLDDAITQMRFSKKRPARDVRWQLSEAHDRAVAAHGMGLGAGALQLDRPREIQTKDGRRITVTDPTRLYVDQAWVNKGPWRGVRMVYHGRGYRSAHRRPTASISIVLKEEKTRIRQHDERVAKEARKAPWTHLPNRPVTAQRPYYSW